MIKKKTNSVGYFSAYYRGLECLLETWPEIRKQVPDATLDVYYGWESWVAMEGEDDFYIRMEEKFAKMQKDGVTVHGRVSHEQLAKAMLETQVWAYPTQFEEIHCITALKAQEARCYPVVTNVAALKETVVSGTKIEATDIYTNKEAQADFIAAVVDALKNKKEGEPVPGTSWAEVAQQWSTIIVEKKNERSTSPQTA